MIILAVVAVVGLVAFLATSGGDDEEENGGGGGDTVAAGDDNSGEESAGDTDDPAAVPEAFITAFAGGDCQGATDLVSQQSQGSLEGMCESIESGEAPEITFQAATVEAVMDGEASVTVTYEAEVISGGCALDPETGECEESEPESSMESATADVTLVQEGGAWKILRWADDEGTTIIEPEGSDSEDIDPEGLDDESEAYPEDDDYDYES